MINVRTRQIIFGALLGTTALTVPARAQQAGYTPPTDVPPVHSRVDQFGVDLVTRNIAAQVNGSISIGPNGPGGLKYVWTNSNRGGSDLNVGLEFTGSSYSVYIGPNTTTFTLNGALGTGTFSNDQGGGETLAYNSSTGQYTFTTSDGAVLLLSSASGAYPIVPQTLTYPAGETLTYYSNDVVTSNLGYQFRPILDPTGQFMNQAVLFNMNDENCDPTASTCTLTGNWPTINFATGTINGNAAVSWITSGSTTTETIPITSTQNETRTYQLDSNGRVNSVTDGNGVWTYSYATGGGATNVFTGNGSGSDPSRQIRLVVWNSANGLVTTDVSIPGVNLGEDEYDYGYDSFQRLTTSKHNGVLTTYQYDTRGNITEVDITPTTGNTGQNIVTKATYPVCTALNTKTCNQPSTTIDGDNNITNYQYDTNHGGVTSVTLPAVNVAGAGSVSPVVTYGYATYNETWKSGTGGTVTGSAVYRPTTVSRCMTQATCTTTTNPNDQVLSTAAYSTTDGLQPLSVTNGSNGNASPVLQATTAYTYNPNGDIQTIDGPLSGTADTTWFAHDNDRRLTGAIGPSPGNGQPMRAVAFTYTTGGALNTASVGTATAQSSSGLSGMSVKQKVQAAYNVQGLKTEDTTYDKTGAVAAISDYNYTPERRNQCVAIRNTLSGGDACTQSSGGTDLITKYTYDDAGNLLTVRKGYTSDSQTPDLTNTWTDAAMLATQQDGKGNTTTYTPDIFNRLSSTCYADSSTDCELLTYDSNNNIVSRRLRDGTTTLSFGYDALNRLTTKTLPEGAVAYGYDLLGNATSLAQGTATLALTYDQLGRNLTQIGPLGSVTSAWDIAGRRTKLTYPDNSYVTYNYLTTGDLQTIADSSATLATYAYDELGNRSLVTYGNGASQTYALDSLYRLSQLTTTDTTYNVTNALTYNPTSQITSVVRNNDKFDWVSTQRSYTYQPNSLNQYPGNGTSSFYYDTKGNLNETVTGSQQTYYCYNSENRLTTVGTSSVCGTPSATLNYDPAGRLSNVSATSTSQFAYDGLNMIAEYDGTSALKARYVFGPAMDEPIVQYDNSGNRTYLSADERGSVIAMTDGSGNETARGTYDEFGLSSAGNLGTERFQYTGQMYLSEVGFYNYKNRLYSPTLGRFLQTDPIGYADGMNWYAYAHGDPVDGSDPLGLDGSTLEPGLGWCGGSTPCGSEGGPTIPGTRGPISSFNNPSDSGGSSYSCLGGFGCDIGSLADPGLVFGQTRSGPGPMWAPPPPALPVPPVCQGAAASRAAKVLTYGGWAQEGIQQIVKAGGGEAAENAIGPAGKLIQVAGAVATFASSVENGEPVDVAAARVVLPLVGGVAGTITGAGAGLVGGTILGAAPGAIVGTVAGAVGGSIGGEKLGDIDAQKYAAWRGYGQCE